MISPKESVFGHEHGAQLAQLVGQVGGALFKPYANKSAIGGQALPGSGAPQAYDFFARKESKNGRLSV